MKYKAFFSSKGGITLKIEFDSDHLNASHLKILAETELKNTLGMNTKAYKLERIDIDREDL